MKANVNGVGLAYDVRGNLDDESVILLHGLGARASTWDAVATALDQSTIAIDLRGHGDSERPGRYSFDLMRDDVLALMDYLGLTRARVVGHSMGGVVAYRMGQQAPTRFDKLILEDPPPPFPRRPPLVPVRDPDEILSFDWQVVDDIMAEVNDPDPTWLGALSDITARTLVIGGGSSSHIDQEQITQLSQGIPHSRMMTIPVGHTIHEDAEAEFIATVRRFLDS